jgi:hypothetical protein
MCEAHREFYAGRIQDRISKGLCIHCGKVDALPERRLCPDCLEKVRLSMKESLRKVRREVFEHYGLSCAHCGETRFNALCIDHINGGGNAHRRELFGRLRGTSYSFYRWLKSQGFPPGFQTLCLTCNLEKGSRPEADLPPHA